jgi:large subunit ribosomal protein L21e
MVSKKAKGKRSNTRRKFRKRGPKASVNKLLQVFEKDQKVFIDVDSSIHSGLPGSRYQGRTGKVIGKSGEIYKVSVGEKKNVKSLLIHPAHMVAVKE